jgi:hypothetical protein
MTDKLRPIFEYRVLLSRSRELGIPLTDAEATRLRRLTEQLPAGVPTLDAHDAHAPPPEALAAECLQGGRFLPCTLRNAGADGMALAVADPPALGQRLLVQLCDADGLVEYAFPGRVVSRVERGLAGIGVAFEGMPTRRALAGRPSGVYGFDEPLARAARR